MISNWDLAEKELGVNITDGLLEVQTMSRYRWIPRYGDPVTTMEKIMQRIIKTLAWLPVYTAIVVTATLLVAIFGVPFVGGR